MERFGFVGLPNAGKSSLYNALAGGGALAAPYAFATTDPNVGVAKVPDARLDALAAMSASRNVVNAAVQFVDIGGLVEGASKGEGLGNRFLAHIREVDAVVFVLRAFTDGDVPGPVDPLDALSVVELELVLADLEAVESQLDKRRKAARADKALAPAVEALEDAAGLLAAGTPLYRAGLSQEVLELLRPWFLLTARPVMAVVNVGEDQLDVVDEVVAPVRSALGDAGEVLAMCVQLEAEAAQLEPGERAELLEGLGLGEGALPRFVRSAYRLLGLRTFFTTGEKESRAWTFCAGWKAPRCAGVIHSDFERGFIRAEVIGWQELVEARVLGQGQGGRAPAGGGQELRAGRRRRRRDPVQRVAVAWLLRDDEVLASLEVARDRRARRRGLLGRDGVDGALLLAGTRSVHTLGMRFALDVAWCDSDLVVLRTATVGRHRLTPPVRGARSVLEAEAGTFSRWGLRPGDRLAVRDGN